MQKEIIRAVKKSKSKYFLIKEGIGHINFIDAGGTHELNFCISGEYKNGYYDSKIFAINGTVQEYNPTEYTPLKIYDGIVFQSYVYDIPELLKLKKFATDDETRPVMQGIYLGEKIVATDGNKLIYSKKEYTYFPNIILPLNFLGLEKFITEFAVSNDKKIAVLSGKDFNIIYQLNDYKFPNYKRVLIDKPKNSIKLPTLQELKDNKKIAWINRNTAIDIKIKNEEFLRFMYCNLIPCREFSDTIYYSDIESACMLESANYEILLMPCKQ